MAQDSQLDVSEKIKNSITNNGDVEVEEMRTHKYAETIEYVVQKYANTSDNKNSPTNPKSEYAKVPNPNEAFLPKTKGKIPSEIPAPKKSLIKPSKVIKPKVFKTTNVGKLNAKKLVYKSFQRRDTSSSQSSASSTSESHRSDADLLDDDNPKVQLLRLRRQRLEMGTWVQCTSCCKWRYLAEVVDPQEVDENWVCSMNKAENLASCDIEQVEVSPSEERTMIHSSYGMGSLVWATVPGFPTWPAMVDDDPDFEKFYWLNKYSAIPTYYNVVFFDSEPVTRAWVAANSITPFNGDNENSFQKPGKEYTKRLEVARNDAKRAATLSVEERLAEFSFLARYPKKLRTKKYQKKRAKKIIKKEKSETYSTCSSQESFESAKTQIVKDYLIKQEAQSETEASSTSETTDSDSEVHSVSDKQSDTSTEQLKPKKTRMQSAQGKEISVKTNKIAAHGKKDVGEVKGTMRIKNKASVPKKEIKAKKQKLTLKPKFEIPACKAEKQSNTFESMQTFQTEYLEISVKTEPSSKLIKKKPIKTANTPPAEVNKSETATKKKDVTVSATVSGQTGSGDKQAKEKSIKTASKLRLNKSETQTDKNENNQVLPAKKATKRQKFFAPVLKNTIETSKSEEPEKKKVKISEADAPTKLDATGPAVHNEGQHTEIITAKTITTDNPEPDSSTPCHVDMMNENASMKKPLDVGEIEQCAIETPNTIAIKTEITDVEVQSTPSDIHEADNTIQMATIELSNSEGPSVAIDEPAPGISTEDHTAPSDIGTLASTADTMNWPPQESPMNMEIFEPSSPLFDSMEE